MATARITDYTDLDLSFARHPVTGDVAKLVGPAAVGRSIKNLVMTNFYERPFRPSVGSGATRLLFENVTPMTASLLEQMIGQVIDNFEPRASVIAIQALASPDLNGYTVKLVFSIVNRPDPFAVTLFLP